MAAHYPHSQVVRADVAKDKGRQKLIESAAATFERQGVGFSVLINNVGTNVRAVRNECLVLPMWS